MLVVARATVGLLRLVALVLVGAVVTGFLLEGMEHLWEATKMPPRPRT